MAPSPGQDWKHGWIPLTAKAVRQKNHGKVPGPDSKLGRRLAQMDGGSGRRSTGTKMDSAIRSRASQRRTRPGPQRPTPRTPADPRSSSGPHHTNPNIPALDNRGLPAARRVGDVSRGPSGSQRIKVETREGFYDAELRNGQVSVTRNGKTFSARVPAGEDPTETVQKLINKHRFSGNALTGEPRPYKTISAKDVRPGMRIYTGDPNVRAEVVKVERKMSGTQFRSDSYVLHYRDLNTGRVHTMSLGTSREPMGLRVYR